MPKSRLPNLHRRVQGSRLRCYVLKSFPPIAAVLLNAGLQFPNGLVLTKEGFENTFAVNHLGHARLFHLLLENKCLANDARIVITASGTHDPTRKSGLPDAEYTTAERLARPTSKEDKEIEERKRLMAGTGLRREAGAVLFFVFKHVLPKFIWLLKRAIGPNVHTAKESEEALAWITTSSEETEVYYEGRKDIKSSVESYERKK